MKKLNLLLVAVMLVGVLIFTGCGKDDPTKDFKNPKTITLFETKQGTVKVSYDDDGTYEEDLKGDTKVLKSSENEFRLAFEIAKKTAKETDDSEGYAKKDDRNKVISDLNFNGYEAYAVVNKEFTSTYMYVYLDKENDVIMKVQISPIMTSVALKELESGKKPEDVLFYKEKVQQILNTIELSSK